jgi:hypothetical protein
MSASRAPARENGSSPTVIGSGPFGVLCCGSRRRVRCAEAAVDGEGEPVGSSPVRNIPDQLDPSAVARIDARLAGVETDHHVVIGWAVESGSRAWGFASPDSDYDCRFLYVHPIDAYLSPWLPRDVIETPLDHVCDVNGWDVRKAVDLMVRGTPPSPNGCVPRSSTAACRRSATC